jgi:hypothetical protein
VGSVSACVDVLMYLAPFGWSRSMAAIFFSNSPAVLAFADPQNACFTFLPAVLLTLSAMCWQQEE